MRGLQLESPVPCLRPRQPTPSRSLARLARPNVQRSAAHALWSRRESTPLTCLPLVAWRGARFSRSAQVKGLEVELYDYKPSLAGDIAGAAIVVSHAGAGTCLEAGRLLLVVVNEFLADNHQLELAGKLKEEGYLEYTTPSGVTDAFCSLAAGERALQPFVPGDPAPFAAWLNNLTGASAPLCDDSKCK